LSRRVFYLFLVLGVLATAGSAWALAPNDANWSLTWPQARVHMPSAWNLTRGSRHVVVAVVDTGVNPKIRDLRGALVPGRDFISGGYTKVDHDGHGTLMASIIAARGNNGRGIPGYCWSCRVMPIRVADLTSFNTSVAAQGVRWAADHGARIITLSFVEDPGSSADPSLAAAIAYVEQARVTRTRQPTRERTRWRARASTTACPPGRRGARGSISRLRAASWRSRDRARASSRVGAR